MAARPASARPTKRRGAPQVAALDPVALRDRLAAAELTAVQLLESCLERVDAREAEVKAWRFLDRDYALKKAGEADEWRKRGRPVGPLHGVPVGLKDIIDTRDMPTENGTPLDAGRRAGRDATIVARLRSAGAVIMGKTVTTELAFYEPRETANPHNPAHTPGGSSSGSAAAVAAHMVPLAVGTQTNGSVIRPAAFCGVVGFKPGFGLIPRGGVLTQSRPLDTIGVFANSIEGAALLADVLAGHDAADPDSRVEAPPRLLELARSEPPLKPLFAFVRQPAWDQAEASTHEAFAELTGELGELCDEVPLPDVFAEAIPAHAALMFGGFSRNLQKYYERGRDQLSERMRKAIEDGHKVTAAQYLTALDWRDVLHAGLEKVFERYDAIITPAAPGEAPAGIDSTGNPAFCTPWTLLGMPAVSLPLMQGPNDLPLGVQLVGPRGNDGRLLRTANWLVRHLNEQTTAGGSSAMGSGA
jgi:Asp-tRNA(Asn)/Glu-tRNA(Gln) amidotransferase A subunit family amidase